MGDQSFIGELVRLSQLYYQRQWMFATAGNLSVRSEKKHSFWITASGKHKGELNNNDFVEIDISSESMISTTDGNKPSAETSIHHSIYNHLPDANSILHVHTLESNLLNFQLTPEEGYRLIPIPPVEMIKAFGIWTERPNLQMATFYNFGEVKKIADTISLFLNKHPDYSLPFVLVEEHGPTVWGKTITEANRHLEAVAFLFQVMAHHK
ncbi:methylthioribulose 1-phosphate dehydratase [Leptospira ilyithenensis]|uniref:Methylthioribulose-1-phosphate dehydratase n=1 Tax=Leptospira ilyithenensis TaxID=2484901 RepID=A0A4R9LT05_9LEPT|nr:methylthioribulose 1-phosphate dehydratase [Leptospira ilyithenensis]TGN14627.1 methylthioribulose 1-phosphate dehydratase [Leptospira ilyithenensis]